MIPRQWLVPCHHRRASVEAHGSSSTHAKAQSAPRVLQFRKIRPADGDSLLPPVRRRFSLAGEHPVRADVSVSPSSPPLSPSTAQPRHRGQTPDEPARPSTAALSAHDGRLHRTAAAKRAQRPLP